jgi:peptidoglycan/LPS O-acetylase OafA/YrhL
VAEPTLSTTGKISFLDAVRGLAILLVYGCHTLDFAYDVDNQLWAGLWRNLHWPGSVQVLWPLNLGHLGVAVFFVISGLCIQLSWHKTAHQGWWAFFNRRFFRIYPPYCLAILAFSFLPIVSPPVFNGLEWLSHLLMLHNLKPEWAWGINSSFWSVGVEWQLYAVFPLLVWAQRRLGWWPLLCLLGGLECALRLYKGLGETGLLPQALPFAVVYSPLGFWFSWSVGAWLGQRLVNRQVPEVPMWLLVILTLALLLALACRITDPLTFPLVAVLTVGLICRALRPQTSPKPLPAANNWLCCIGTKASGLLFRHLSFVGVISYSLYLVHQPLLLRLTPVIMAKLNLASSVESRLLAAVLAWPVVLLLSWGLYHWLELPSIRLGQKVARYLPVITAKPLKPLPQLTTDPVSQPV